jgi:saccharopine dehydrogenase (NAD+, L-lysine forming)
VSGSDAIELWLRAESRAGEARAPLTPEAAAVLATAGVRVVVERSGQRCFPDAAYHAGGCRLAAAGAWQAAPADSFILGLKELPRAPSALHHRHIYFGHAYKQQPGAGDLLARFRRGGGELLDLEYLCDGDGRRLAAFGYWAGYVGAALGLLAWAGQHTGRRPALAPLAPWRGREALLAELERALAPALALAAPPRALVIGAAGRCGRGARDLLAALGLGGTGWDLPETRAGGPFEAILAFDLLVNCVLLQSPLPPFLTPDLLARPARRLRVISDVSCDPGSPHNPLPLYQQVTSFAEPALRLQDGLPQDGLPQGRLPQDGLPQGRLPQDGLPQGRLPLDLIAIDNLPSLLPAEASADFSAQLLPALLQLRHVDTAPWASTRDLFHHHCQRQEHS